MDLKSTLNKIGLNEKEANIYLACLEHGPETVTNIARLSGYKRTTLYNIIEDLVRRGFLLTANRNRRIYYDAEQPKNILANFKSRQKELELILPNLESLRANKFPLPKIEIYDSSEAISRVYDDIFEFVAGGGEVAFLSFIADLDKYAVGLLDKWFAVLAKNNCNVKARELIYDDEAGRKYCKILKQKKVKYPVRLLPAESSLYNDTILYGDRAAIFSFHQRSFVTIIENKEVVQTLKTLYELAWLNGRKI